MSQVRSAQIQRQPVNERHTSKDSAGAAADASCHATASPANTSADDGIYMRIMRSGRLAQKNYERKHHNRSISVADAAYPRIDLFYLATDFTV
jgi:hypothetical protein